ncbi:hypothetical protein ACWEOZ_18045 [Actinoplanes sp. NPDC004185]
MRELALCVATAERVSSGVTIFLGRLYGLAHTDAVDPRQGVALRWRELGGMTQSGELLAHLRAELPSLRERVSASGLPGSAVAAAALDAIGALTEDPEGLARITGHALGVAAELDRASVPPPRGHGTWAAFEVRSQSDLADLLAGAPEEWSPEFLDELRTEAGMQSMAYRNGMKALGRS